jgi:hypothetical protein
LFVLTIVGFVGEKMGKPFFTVWRVPTDICISGLISRVPFRLSQYE